jgi:hypothetical protein
MAIDSEIAKVLV